ncbi:MAG: hypothetical protein ABSA46_02550 [Thermodesulfovibrionales bacterium]|jgi:hypothetical protein
MDRLPRGHYTKEFRLEAVKPVIEGRVLVKEERRRFVAGGSLHKKPTWLS